MLSISSRSASLSSVYEQSTNSNNPIIKQSYFNNIAKDTALFLFLNTTKNTTFHSFFHSYMFIFLERTRRKIAQKPYLRATQ